MSIPFLLLLWSSAFFVVRFSREHIYIVCRVSAYELMVHLVNGGENEIENSDSNNNEV